MYLFCTFSCNLCEKYRLLLWLLRKNQQPGSLAGLQSFVSEVLRTQTIVSWAGKPAVNRFATPSHMSLERTSFRFVLLTFGSSERSEIRRTQQWSAVRLLLSFSVVCDESRALSVQIRGHAQTTTSHLWQLDQKGRTVALQIGKTESQTTGFYSYSYDTHCSVVGARN